MVRYVAELALAFDHRQIDGALASRVLAHVGNFLRDPATALWLVKRASRRAHSKRARRARSCSFHSR